MFWMGISYKYRSDFRIPEAEEFYLAWDTCGNHILIKSIGTCIERQMIMVPMTDAECLAESRRKTD